MLPVCIIPVCSICLYVSHNKPTNYKVILWAHKFQPNSPCFLQLSPWFYFHMLRHDGSLDIILKGRIEAKLGGRQMSDIMKRTAENWTRWIGRKITDWRCMSRTSCYRPTYSRLLQKGCWKLVDEIYCLFCVAPFSPLLRPNDIERGHQFPWSTT